MNVSLRCIDEGALVGDLYLSGAIRSKDDFVHVCMQFITTINYAIVVISITNNDNIRIFIL